MASAITIINLSLMLFYHGRGERDYATSPHRISHRAHWEFAAILSGHAAPLLRGTDIPPTGPALWIFPPRHPHGWQGGTCTICTLHLAACPRLIADAVSTSEQGFLHVPLNAAERRTLARVDREVADFLSHHPDAGEIAADHFRGLLGSIAVQRLGLKLRQTDVDDRKRIKQVIAWLEAHLEDGVGIAEAAKACHISPAHLRRLCHQVSGRSPRDLLEELRLDRARDLLRKDTSSIEAIAWRVGYTSATALSQAFNRRYGIRPGAWRRQAGMP